MNIKSLKLAYFSPTGTTRKIIYGIAKGINHPYTNVVDLTSPHEREQALVLSENDLIIIGVPVYMGRVPALLDGWLQRLKGQNTPAVCVAVYGNRAYENALLELKDGLTESGCVTIAGAAYIGEHSFSSAELPIAENRPNKQDLDHAERFGRNIKEKLAYITSTNQFSNLDIPGTHPYGGVTELWNVDFIAVNERCTQCGLCAEECPMDAIDPENSYLIDIEKCITCCACIKNCPENARSIKPGLVKDVAKRLNSLCSEQKEPVCFY